MKFHTQEKALHVAKRIGCNGVVLLSACGILIEGRWHMNMDHKRGWQVRGTGVATLPPTGKWRKKNVFNIHTGKKEDSYSPVELADLEPGSQDQKNASDPRRNLARIALPQMRCRAPGLQPTASPSCSLASLNWFWSEFSRKRKRYRKKCVQPMNSKPACKILFANQHFSMHAILMTTQLAYHFPSFLLS